MNKQEKVKFVEELSAKIIGDIINDITANNIPENWDGLELRLLTAERFDRQSVHMSKQRWSDYNNTILVRNL